MNKACFIIKGNPVPCPRPRVVKKHAYIPQRAVNYIDTISWEVKLKMRSNHDSGGLWAMQVYFFRGDKRRCDIDNLCKSIMDALTNIKYWEDDSQLVDLRAVKGYNKENPRVEIYLWKK